MTSCHPVWHSKEALINANYFHLFIWGILTFFYVSIYIPLSVSYRIYYVGSKNCYWHLSHAALPAPLNCLSVLVTLALLPEAMSPMVSPACDSDNGVGTEFEGSDNDGTQILLLAIVMRSTCRKMILMWAAARRVGLMSETWLPKQCQHLDYSLQVLLQSS